MSKDRLVTPPANARGIYIPQEYIEICTTNKTRAIPQGKDKGGKREVVERNLAAAAILRMIERWAHWKIRMARGKMSWQDAWVWMAQNQFEEFELVNAFGGGQIKTGIQLLLDKGFITRRNNPNKAFDRTYQYRFEKDAVQDALNKLTTFTTIDDWKNESSSMEQSDAIDATMNSDEAIPQVPSQEEQQTLSGAQAAPEPRYAVGQRVAFPNGAQDDNGQLIPAGALGTVRGWLGSDVYEVQADGQSWCTWVGEDEFTPVQEPPALADPPTPPEPPADPAPKPAPEKRKGKPRESKPRPDDPLFDLIAQRSFGVDPRGPDVKPLGGRIGILRGIATGKSFDVVELQAAYDWYKRNRKGCTSPRGSVAFTNMLNDYRNSKPTPRRETNAEPTVMDSLMAQIVADERKRHAERERANNPEGFALSA